MKTIKPYWIKERNTPQLGTYYVPYGQMSRAKAKKHEKSLYGYNIMHAFKNEAAYLARLTKLRAKEVMLP